MYFNNFQSMFEGEIKLLCGQNVEELDDLLISTINDT